MSNYGIILFGAAKFKVQCCPKGHMEYNFNYNYVVNYNVCHLECWLIQANSTNILHLYIKISAKMFNYIYPGSK